MEEYRMTVRQVRGDSGELRLSCGVALYRDGVCLAAADDLSPDPEAVSQLVQLFNEEGLDPVHFDQAVEDFLTDLTV